MGRDSWSIAGSEQASLAGIKYWQGDWATSTNYIAGDGVANDGSSYICTVAHTSGSDDEEPGTGANWENYWNLLASKGDAGAGGDSDAIHDNVAAEISAISGKTTPVDADVAIIEDSADSNNKKSLTWANIKATMKTYMDTLYSALGHSHTESDITDLDHTDSDAIHDNVASEISSVSEKASPVSADLLLIEDSADSNNKKRVQIGNLPTGSDSDAIHDNVAAEISAITEKTTPVDADVALIEDSAASNAKKRLSWSNIKATLKTYFDTLYAELSHTHTESDITDLDHDATKIQGVTVDDTSKADGKVLKYNGTSGNIEYQDDNEGAGGGDSDAIHDNVAGEIAAVSGKTTPVDADVALIEDSADSNNKKSLTWANIKATLKTYFDTLYEAVSGLTFTENTDGFEIAGGSSSERTLTVSGGDVTITAGTPAKGDLLVGDGSDLAAVAVGSNDQIIVADSAQSRGIKWADDIATLNFIIDGGGEAITTGVKGMVQIDFDCTIQQVTTLGDQSGSVVVDIWKDSYANFPATDADSITASAPPTLSSAQKSQDSSLSGWTTAVSAGDHLIFNVDSATTVTRVTIALKIKKTR